MDQPGTEDHLPARPANEQTDGSHLAIGYGHRAYQPDPNATYVFQPGPPRTLRVSQQERDIPG